ncbi:MFS transporter [Bailinhaonella thermotolerans]|uniref:MFS transporter n=1 Tax=Bailinhaonella thermotolerans TaxID=1070861 RepID=UPI001F5BD599|nr:MFS transporter [Bailinhaonella thermotolerans]
MTGGGERAVERGDGRDAGLSAARGRWLLVATILGSGMAFLDSSAVNVALPRLGEEMDASVSGLQWTVNAYMLTLSALVLLGGALGDRFGRRRVFVLGVVWFAAASLACGLAPNIGVLAVARAVQGVGAALLTPGSLALLQALFPADRRAWAIGVWSGLSGLAGVAGPLLGGWLVQTLGWRWVFFINLPLAVAVVLITLWQVPESSSPGHGRFDVPGAVLGALTLAGLTVCLIEAPSTGWGSPLGAGSLAVGLASAVAFVLVERRVSAPMLPPGIFRSRRFTGANLATLAIYAALSGVGFFLVIELQITSGYGALAAGSAMLPVTLLLMLLSGRAGSLSQRIGPRVPMTLGPLLAAAGTLLMLRVGPRASYVWDVLPGQVVFGLGLALTVAPLTATVLAAAEDRYAGLASGVNNAAARIAGLLAVAGLPTVVGLTGEAYKNPPLLDATYHRALWICAGLLALGGLISWLTIGPRPENVQDPRS